MKTEKNDTHQAGEKKKLVVTPKRIGWWMLNVFVPVSDVSSMLRYTGGNLSQLGQRFRDVTRRRTANNYRPVSWSQAVEDSGLSPAMLRRNYCVGLWTWWALMCLTGLPVLGFMMLLLASGSDVSATGWLRVGCVMLVLGLLSVTGFVQALRVSYRLWQLEEQRVSASEKGSFRDFLSETRWCRRVLSAGLFR